MNIPDEPDEALSSNVLLALDLVDDELLDGGRLGGGGSEALTEFLGAD